MSHAGRLAAEMGWDDGVAGLLGAYAIGAFPMGDPLMERVAWYRPDPRAILPLELAEANDDRYDGFKVSGSLRKRVRSRRFEVTCNTAFDRVVRACAEPRVAHGKEGRDESGVWITDTIIEAMEAVHAVGHAHSVEIWRTDEDGDRLLVGGIYGVSLGRFFAGESMFSRPMMGGRDASKVALVHCWTHLVARGYTLFDVQFHNDHLDRFGCEEITDDEYQQRLAEAVEHRLDWGDFDPERAIRWACDPR